MDDTAPRKPLSRVIQEKLAASRFLTFSLLLHVILVVMGGSVVLFKQYVEPPDFTASGGGIVSNEVSVAPPEEQPQTMEQQFTPEAPTISPPTVTAITTAAANPAAFQMASIPVPVKAMPSDMSKNITDMSKNITRALGSGLPSAMQGRAGGTARQQMMQKTGGKEKSELAVMKGLRWLKDHQNEDGSWSDQFKPAMTGFAILCFLGHGETPESPEFGPTVKKGVDWLLARGNEFQGRMSLTKEGWGTGNDGVYQHAIATYAMGEYYTMTKDERFAELLKLAVTHIVQGQAPDGGWNYRYSKEPNSDTSVSGWQIQALKAAHLTGLGIPGVDESLDKAMLDLKRVQGPKGGFGYRKPEDRYSLTGVGVLCTYFWKQDKDKTVKDGLEFMLENSDREFPVKYKHEKADLYAWYYNTQACLMYGGSAWTKWNRLFQDEIADAQSQDGSWPPVAGNSPGGGLQREPDGAGPFYRTSLCILMLEVFYRYMPINK
jgi:hypothetical protein